MMSPSLFVWQPPPNPSHSVLPAMGPITSAPVALLYTAKAVLTRCTNCVAPTAPLVSDGAQLQGLAGVLLVSPIPAKFSPATVPTCGPAAEDWTTGSGRTFAPCGTGRRRKGISHRTPDDCR